jgi:hypothetical protein
MEAISSIGSLFSGIKDMGSSTMPLWQKIAGLGAGGAGTIGNILASNKRNQVLQQELDVQKQLMGLTPSAMAAGASQLERPLSAGLTSSVGNAVQGYLAERGLSQAPGIQATTLAQGLAPFKMQEQQLAMNAFLQKLGLPAQAAARFLPTPGSIDLSKLFQGLFSKPDPSGSIFRGAPQPTMQQLDPNGGNWQMPSGVDTNGLPPMSMQPPDVSGSGWAGTGGGNFNWMNFLTPSGLVPSPVGG